VWTSIALGYARYTRATEARPGWEVPLSAIQNTRRAEAYGSAVITCRARADNGAVRTHEQPRSELTNEATGAWVAEITGMLNLSSWPEDMRVIVRKERPHPGAQLRFTDIGGHRFTCFVTSTKGGQLADPGLRHRQRARCEDRILLQPS